MEVSFGLENMQGTDPGGAAVRHAVGDLGMPTQSDRYSPVGVRSDGSTVGRCTPPIVGVRLACSRRHRLTMRSGNRARTIALPPYSADLEALRDRETPAVVPIPAPRSPDVKGAGPELENRVARAMRRGWHRDRYWVSCRARPTGERWTEQGRDIICHVSPGRYFRERLEQTSSITTTLMAVGRAELEDSMRGDIVEDLLGAYGDELGRCPLPPEVLAVVRRAGLDLEPRSSRFYDVARRFRSSLVEGRPGTEWEGRKLCRRWVLELVADGNLNQVQGAALELLVELFVLQGAEARDVEAARENAACPAELPAAVEDLRRSGDAKAPVLARRLTEEGVPIEVEERSGGRAEIVCARLHPMREEGLCPEPPVFTG